MKAIYKSMICLLCIGSLFASCKSESGKKGSEAGKTSSQTAQNMKTDKAFDASQLGEEPVFIIRTTAGDIKVKLYSDTPMHRDNFIRLAQDRFYDDIMFHRIIRNFMIQTGDPFTKDPSAPKAKYGTGGPGYTIKAEILPHHTHLKGALAAARRGDSVNPAKESSGSQFYIVHNESTCRQLDGEYTVFGETIEGFEVIDAIADAATDERDRPVDPIRIISVLPEIQETPSEAAEVPAEAETQAE